MVTHGLTISIPWLALVNIGFALMVLLRNGLFDNIDALYQVNAFSARTIDLLMLAVIILFSFSLLLVWQKKQGLSLLMLLSGLIWSGCAVWFIAHLKLPFAWPLCTTLLLTALAGLYFYPVGLISYALPLWAAMPVASLVLNQGVTLRFAVVWLIFTVVLVYGRFILVRWFDEAWLRHQQNQALIARLDALAHQDPLTATANRRAMETVLAHMVEQKKGFALIMLDVDEFKRYNDFYGHQAGDACLAAVAQALKQVVRSPDDLVSRYGGEEFLLILFDATEKVAEQVAARIQERLRVAAIPHAASTVSDSVTVSMGIALMTVGQTASQVIAQADAALYRAKNAGRNRWSC
ncbi:GGDEF domain-containing protein [Leclercia adecarboxylata]|uniref:GGDEF domain-containing protein n=1 Tax=Leclercia adecarboxylata TaxID=83655 RepID=UPI002DB6342F|nr:membrane-associated sensor domain-containing protein [Leclercia adecarboxylata]MEB6377903.1 GGDEF domain-containing protein [Leclercia adecarboxylata]